MSFPFPFSSNSFLPPLKYCRFPTQSTKMRLFFPLSLRATHLAVLVKKWNSVRLSVWCRLLHLMPYLLHCEVEDCFDTVPEILGSLTTPQMLKGPHGVSLEVGNSALTQKVSRCSRKRPLISISAARTNSRRRRTRVRKKTLSNAVSACSNSAKLSIRSTIIFELKPCHLTSGERLLQSASASFDLRELLGSGNPIASFKGWQSLTLRNCL